MKGNARMRSYVEQRTDVLLRRFPCLPMLLVAAMPVIGFGEIEGPYTYVVTNGSAIITAFDKAYGGILVVTNALGGYPVRSIGQGAFWGCTNLTEVIVQEGVLSIGDSAFRECWTVRRIEIPGTVTGIGENAFRACRGISNIALPASVREIGAEAFAQSGLTNVILGEGVVAIGRRAFYACPLTAVAIPDNVTSVGEGAFLFCSALTNVVIGSGLTDITASVFAYCHNLEGLTWGANVKEIGAEAFFGCENLARTVIPDSVTYIGRSAFLFSGLTSVTIGHSVTAIAEYALGGGDLLERVYFTGDAPVTEGVGPFKFSENVTVYYLPGSRGWDGDFAGRPAKLWNPTFADFAISDEVISCTVTGTLDIPVAIQVATNLQCGWVTVQVTNLAVGALQYQDLALTEPRIRYYRIAGP